MDNGVNTILNAFQWLHNTIEFPEEEGRLVYPALFREEATGEILMNFSEEAEQLEVLDILLRYFPCFQILNLGSLIITTPHEKVITLLLNFINTIPVHTNLIINGQESLPVLQQSQTIWLGNYEFKTSISKAFQFQNAVQDKKNILKLNYNTEKQWKKWRYSHRSSIVEYLKKKEIFTSKAKEFVSKWLLGGFPGSRESSEMFNCNLFGNRNMNTLFHAYLKHNILPRSCQERLNFFQYLILGSGQNNIVWMRMTWLNLINPHVYNEGQPFEDHFIKQLLDLATNHDLFRCSLLEMNELKLLKWKEADQDPFLDKEHESIPVFKWIKFCFAYRIYDNSKRTFEINLTLDENNNKNDKKQKLNL